jgi:hypothetical protein
MKINLTCTVRLPRPVRKLLMELMECKDWEDLN